MDKMRFNSPYVSTQKTKYLVTGTSLKRGVINSGTPEGKQFLLH